MVCEENAKKLKIRCQDLETHLKDAERAHAELTSTKMLLERYDDRHHFFTHKFVRSFQILFNLHHSSLLHFNLSVSPPMESTYKQTET